MKTLLNSYGIVIIQLIYKLAHRPIGMMWSALNRETFSSVLPTWKIFDNRILYDVPINIYVLQMSHVQITCIFFFF